MLAIRMQRTGRKGSATFRIVVQDTRFTPTSGRIVAQVGHSNPHTKETVLDAEKINQYLGNGAQPTPRVVRLLQADKVVKLPEWVKVSASDKKRKTKNAEKLRKNQPKEEVVDEPAEEEAAAEESETPESPEEAALEESTEKTEEPAADTEEKSAE